MKKKGFWPTVDKALVIWCSAIMGVMSVMVILSVFFRYVFGLTFVWSEELIVYMFITTTYFGAILCVHESEHIDMSLLNRKLPERANKLLKVIIGIINLVVQAALAYISIDWIRKTGSSISIGIKVPYTYIYAMFPLCFVSMAVYEARKISGLLRPQAADLEGQQ